MSKKNDPNLPSNYMLLPMGGGNEILEFWSGLFASNANATVNSLDDFPKTVVERIHMLGYRGNPIDIPQQVTFSKGFIGVGRRMWEYHNGRAKVILYFKPLNDMYYVSLRLVYPPPPISLLKLRWFQTQVVAMTLFLRVIQAFEYSNNYYNRVDTLEDAFRWMLFGERFFETLLMLGCVAIFMVFTRGMPSFLKTGSFLGFLQEDFQEIYRDDLASIGQAVFAILMSTADELSLNAIRQEDTPPPAFGAIPANARNRRSKRI